MSRLLIFSVIILCFALPLSAQPVDTAWVRIYNGDGNIADQAWGIAVDDSGNVYVTGQINSGLYSGDYCTVKYYPNGDTAWVRVYDGPRNDVDLAYDVAVDRSGYIYVTGQSLGDTTTGRDFATIKYDPDGDIVWLRRYDGPASEGDGARALALDDSGNVYVTGSSTGNGTFLDYATIKYYPNGDTAWIRRYNDLSNLYDTPRAIAVDGSGNVYVTGDENSDYATIKYYPNGDTAWVRRYDGPSSTEDVADAIAVDGSGNVYVTGHSDSSGYYNYDYLTIKYYSNGDTAWVRRYNGTLNDWDGAEAVAVDGSGNVYVTGASQNIGTGSDLTTIKYYPNGDTAWTRSYNGPDNLSDRAFDIALDNSGDIYVAGYSMGTNTSQDCITIKYDSNGEVDWVRKYDGPSSAQDFNKEIVVDGSGNIYVTGVSFGSGTDYNYVTIKYVPFQQSDDTLRYIAYSPVDIIVTDPNSDSIGIDFNTIPDATYDTTLDVNEDEDKDDVVTIPNPLIGEYMVRVVGEAGSGGGSYTLSVKLNGNEDTPLVSGTAPGPGEVDTVYYPVLEYLRGDANTDGSTSISDVIFLINYLFKGGIPPVPLLVGDANCCQEGDGSCTVVNLSVSDVIYLINYLFKGGTAPCS